LAAVWAGAADSLVRGGTGLAEAAAGLLFAWWTATAARRSGLGMGCVSWLGCVALVAVKHVKFPAIMRSWG